jgi:hypothetical protein
VSLDELVNVIWHVAHWQVASAAQLTFEGWSQDVSTDIAQESRTEGRPRSRPGSGRAMVDPDGSPWRTGATIANDRAMPQRRLAKFRPDFPPRLSD